MGLAIDRKLLRWGSGYGLRLTAKEIAKLGLRPGEPVHAQVSPAHLTNDFSSLAAFDFPPWPKGKTVDEVLDDDALEEHGARRRH